MNGKLGMFNRIVVKIGSSLLIDKDSNVNLAWLSTLASDIAELADGGARIMVVSSGAIALGRRQMRNIKPDLMKRDLDLEESQAASAIGQIHVSGAYESALDSAGLKTAQILLTIEDTETRRRYLNARATLGTLLKWGLVPVINENDTVATTEIRYGDNDRLAARVASMMEADLLILLSDVEGLYSEPPDTNPDAKLLKNVTSLTPEIFSMAGDAASRHSRGGMKTKLEAARIATESGATMVISSGRYPHALKRIDDSGPCTWFQGSDVVRNARKKWIAGGLVVPGKVTIDNGALLALEAGKSLLPSGVLSISGEFSRGDTVSILGPNGHLIGRGLIEYGAREAGLIVGLNSHQISKVVGSGIRAEMIHRDNLVLDSTGRIITTPNDNA